MKSSCSVDAAKEASLSQQKKKPFSRRGRAVTKE